MDIEITTLLESATRRALLDNQLEMARVRFSELTRYSFNGGTFQISETFLLTLDRLISEYRGHSILIDLYGIPVEIDFLIPFRDAAQRQYTAAIRRFHIDVKAARDTHLPDMFDV